MALNIIKSTYDAIISLGGICQVVYQIERKNLKTFSGPIDWKSSPHLSNVNKLLKNRFKDFMNINNLTVEGKANIDTYIVKDHLYNIESWHDFPTKYTDDPLYPYPEFKDKLDRRINTFFKKCRDSDSILFIRLGADYNDVVELVSTLQNIVKNEFQLLVVNLSKNPGLRELNWGLKNVCSIEIMDTISTRWQGCDALWDQIFEGISLRSNK